MNNFIKRTFSLVLTISMIFGISLYSTPVSASSIIKIEQSSLSKQASLEISRISAQEIITKDDLNVLRKFADIEIEELDEHRTLITIHNRHPEKVIHYSNGDSEAQYVITTIYSGYISNTYNGVFQSQVVGELHYSWYNLTLGEQPTKLVKTTVRYTSSLSSAYIFSLSVSAHAAGFWQDQDGSSGFTDELVTLTSPSNPVKGQTYTAHSPSPHYYTIYTVGDLWGEMTVLEAYPVDDGMGGLAIYPIHFKIFKNN